ncbi:MAG: VOC family protein [Alphaproteobacteria bacterium]|jgi:predicted enzyme related to lactoylglutathione lyase
MTVEKLQNAYYVTSDMERAVGFYRDALGLDLMFQDGEKWTQFKAGGVNFAMASDDEAPDGAVGATVVFEVDDIATMSAAIEAAGGEIFGTRDMGDHGKTLTFRDPDGNLVQLYQRAS